MIKSLSGRNVFLRGGIFVSKSVIKPIWVQISTRSSFFIQSSKAWRASACSTWAEGRRRSAGAQGDFVVDERVVETCPGSIVLVATIIQVVKVRPVDGSQAHGARLARGVEVAPREVERAQPAGGLADGVDLGMGGGVVVGRHAVGALGHDDTVLHYHGGEGAAARFTLSTDRAIARRMNCSL